MLISVFEDNIANHKEIATFVTKLYTAFPKMEEGFWNILTERIIANNFTKERIKQAVEYVIDNFQYKELNVADIIRFDRRIKLYTGGEYVLMQVKGAKSTEFEKRIINGTVYFVKKDDLLN